MSDVTRKYYVSLIERPWFHLLVIVLICFGTIVSLIVLGWLLAVGIPAHPWTVEKLGKQVAKDLPPGSPVEKVEKWLIAHDIQYTKTTSPKPFTGDEPGQFFPPGANQNGRKIGVYIHGALEDTRRGIFCRSSIQVWFYFDEDYELIGYDVKEFKNSL